MGRRRREERGGGGGGAKMVQRVTYRRRHCYATKSNRMRRLRTPGGKIVVQRVQKRASVPTCGEAKCSLTLPGIPALRPTAMSQKRLSRKNSRSTASTAGISALAACA